MKDFRGKVAFITGSSRGIGRSIAIELARGGADVIVHGSSNSEVIKETLKTVQQFSKKSRLVLGKVQSLEDMNRIAVEINRIYPTVDILVNNAGIVRDRTVAKMTYKEWNEVIEVNLTGVFNATSVFLKLIPSGGRIINITSIIGIKGGYGQANYAATKAGVIAFSKSLALELSSKKITVNAVAPGYTNTDMVANLPKTILEDKILAQIPLRRLAEPDEVAKLVAFIASEECDYITGQVFGITGGIII